MMRMETALCIRVPFICIQELNWHKSGESFNIVVSTVWVRRRLWSQELCVFWTDNMQWTRIFVFLLSLTIYNANGTSNKMRARQSCKKRYKMKQFWLFIFWSRICLIVLYELALILIIHRYIWHFHSMPENDFHFVELAIKNFMQISSTHRCLSPRFVAGRYI